MDILNNWYGFFALVAAIVSIASLCFGIWQYKKTQKQRLQEMQDELEILESKSRHMFGLCNGIEYLSFQSRLEYLHKQLKRK